MLAPVDPERASYSPLLFLLLMAASFALAFVLVRRLYHGRLRRAAPWDCGFPLQTRACRTPPRASASRSGRSSSPSSASSGPADARSTRSRATAWKVGDHFWHWLYLPVARAGPKRVAPGRPAAAGTHLDLPDVQLRHAAGAAGAGERR
jgi:hydrogenase-4 component B